MINLKALKVEKQDKIEGRIEELSNEIEEYVGSGGDIYAERRELPYYERLRSIVRSLRKEFDNPDISYEDVYSLCGIKFDREWNTFMTWIEKVENFADEEGCVDSMRTDRGVDSVYSDLSYYASKNGTSAFDFLVLMTPFMFKESLVTVGDYNAYLKDELKDAYRDGETTGIKRDEPTLYEKIRQAQKYTPNATGQDMLEMFDVSNDRFSDSRQIDIPKNDAELVEKLEELYPDRVVKNLIRDHKKTYYDIVRAARNQGKSPKVWIESKGFDYPAGVSNNHPLTKTKIDTKKRAEMLRQMKAEIMSQIDLEGADDIDIFHANLEATKKVIEIVNEKYKKDSQSQEERK